MLIVKVGGGKNINWDYIAEDLVNLIKKEKVVLIHGASSRRDEIANLLNRRTKTVVSPSGISSVYTDSEALEVFLMVYAGLVNKQIVANLRQYGLNAVGLSGVDGGLWQAKAKKEIFIKEGKKVKLLKNNLTGKVKEINIGLINLLLDNNYLPVICPPAISYENEIVNTDNDWATAVMAGSLKAEEIAVLFEAPGLLRNVSDKKTLIERIDKNRLEEYLAYANGRMKKKVLGAKKAFDLGVKKIYWGDGRIKNPISSALAGKGTVIL